MARNYSEQWVSLTSSRSSRRSSDSSKSEFKSVWSVSYTRSSKPCVCVWNVEKKKQRSEKRNPLIIKSIENATAAITTKIKPNVYVFSLSHTHRWFGMFRFKRSQRTSNCRNMIYCFMLTRIIVQFCIQFLKTWPHYLIYWRFSYRFTNSNEK